MSLNWAFIVLLAATPNEPEKISRADALLARGDAAAAANELESVTSSAAALERARAYRLTRDATKTHAALEQAAKDPLLTELVELERGLLAAALGDAATTLAALWPLVERQSFLLSETLAALPPALVAQDPAKLVSAFATLERSRRPDDLDARSFLLGQKSEAHRRLGQTAEATLTDKQRYLEEPVSLLTPTSPPAGVSLTSEELLARIEVLQSAHRSDRVVSELRALKDASLSPAQRCQKQLGLGLALRKLRDYTRAAVELEQATQSCADGDERQKRAAYLLAKVVSIKDGLAAVPIIEGFVQRYSGDTMVDDVLFWAGDLYQRRARFDEAAAYFQRILSLPLQDDQCGEAAWRLAWMRYRRNDASGATQGFTRLLSPSSCKLAAFDRARAHYWLGRLLQTSDPTLAATHFESAFRDDALGFYAQASFTRLTQLANGRARSLAQAAAPPGATTTPTLCKGSLAENARFALGEAWLALGLKRDAARAFLAIPVPTRTVLAPSHASAQGLSPQPVAALTKETNATCDERTPRLLLALMLDRAGAYKDAHWRLRTDFADELATLPRADTWALWRAAYPLAWRDELAAAEREQHLPELFLQALAREESAFDPQVVSWAGAYGLTQLLFSAGQDSARRLRPRLELGKPEDLLDPEKNARLGGAMLAFLLKRFQGNEALALAAYNAGTDVAVTWWKRHQADELDVLAEEITIQETRGYVKRVLRTYGIYRWLYRTEPPSLPVVWNLPTGP